MSPSIDQKRAHRHYTSPPFYAVVDITKGIGGLPLASEVPLHIIIIPRTADNGSLSEYLICELYQAAEKHVCYVNPERRVTSDGKKLLQVSHIIHSDNESKLHDPNPVAETLYVNNAVTPLDLGCSIYLIYGDIDKNRLSLAFPFAEDVSNDFSKIADLSVPNAFAMVSFLDRICFDSFYNRNLSDEQMPDYHKFVDRAWRCYFYIDTAEKFLRNQADHPNIISKYTSKLNPDNMRAILNLGLDSGYVLACSEISIQQEKQEQGAITRELRNKAFNESATTLYLLACLAADEVIQPLRYSNTPLHQTCIVLDSYFGGIDGCKAYIEAYRKSPLYDLARGYLPSPGRMIG